VLVVIGDAYVAGPRTSTVTSSNTISLDVLLDIIMIAVGIILFSSQLITYFSACVFIAIWLLCLRMPWKMGYL